MILYPAVDIKGGQAVRLLHGRADQITTYGSPLQMALNWKAAGAQWLHIVDLDGAFTGERQNADVVRDIVRTCGLPVQLGGGIRTEEDAAGLLEEIGVSRVVIGTAAFTSPGLIARLAARFGDAVAVGIDARNGVAMVKGWVEASGQTAAELARRVYGEGVRTVVYTDIGRDGALSGPNVEATAALVREAPGLCVIGSGGVSQLSDIIDLKRVGCVGTILGKALYERKFTLEEALKKEMQT